MRHPCRWLPIVLLFSGCMKPLGDPPTAGDPKEKQSPPSKKEKAEPAAEFKGTINGKEFKPDKIELQGHQLSFSKGKEFFADMQIMFSLPNSEKSYQGKEWKFDSDDFSNPTLQVSAREGDKLPKTDFVFPKDYTMTLKITKHDKKVIEGTIDLKVTKPEKTMLSGKFVGVVKRTAQDPLDAEDAPYVQGKITIPGKWKDVPLAAGFVAKGEDGKNHSNMAGSSFSHDGGGWVTSSSFEPQLTSIVGDKKDGVVFKHTHLKPGEYWVYVKRHGVVAAWKSVTVKKGDQLTVDLSIDPTKTGKLVVTIPDEEAKEQFEEQLRLIPEGLKLPGGDNHYLFGATPVKKGVRTVKLDHVPAGKYKVTRGKSEGTVEVVVGKESAVTLDIVKEKD